MREMAPAETIPRDESLAPHRHEAASASVSSIMLSRRTRQHGRDVIPDDVRRKIGVDLLGVAEAPLVEHGFSLRRHLRPLLRRGSRVRVLLDPGVVRLQHLL